MKAVVLAVLLALAAPARAAPPLTVLADTGTEMPLARSEGGKLVGGIHYDLGQAIAAGLGRPVRYAVMPRNRVALALEQGKADLMCMYVPEWLPGPFDWTRPFIPFAEVIVTDRRQPRPTQLRQLAGKRIGTVLGYRHPEVEEVLGKDFKREDGPSTETNLHKMVAGRLDHVIASNLYIGYRLRYGEPRLSIHEPLIVKTMRLQCAVSRAGTVRVDDVNRVMAELVRDGAIDRILDRYR
jgi:ABC-type amino acid transport substrate-binding protein